jgi:hypothetical protein
VIQFLDLSILSLSPQPSPDGWEVKGEERNSRVKMMVQVSDAADMWLMRSHAYKTHFVVLMKMLDPTVSYF